MADDTLDTDQPDFCLSLEDNCRISFLVKGLTKTSGPVVKDVLKYMKSLSPFQAESGPKRGSSQASQDILCLRFLSGLPRWLMEGKESQRSPAALTSGGSKRLFGYLGIAHCYDPDDFIEAESNYKNDMQRFSQHLITSKCLVFGENEELKSSLKGHDSFVLVPFKKDDIVSSSSKKLFETLTHSVLLVHSNLTISVSNKQLLKKAGSLNHHTESGILTDEQQRHQHARSLKVKADLYLLMGQYSTAATVYKEALLLLRQSKDHLWVALSLEGLLSSRLLSTVQYTSLLQLSDATDDVASRGPVDMSTNSEKESASHSSDSSAISLEPVDTTDSGSPGPDFPDGFEGVGGSTDSIEKDFNFLLDRTGAVDRILYIEASLKYSSYLIQQKNYSKACHVLEELTAGTDTTEPQLKLSLYLALSSLYNRMSLHRKTMFMLVSAAREAVKITKMKTEVADKEELNLKAYNLLKYCISQFSDETNDQCPQVNMGWPLLQSTIIREYTYMCTALGYSELFFKWSWLLLQNFYSYLSCADIDKIKKCIEKMSGGDSVKSAPFSLTSIPRISTLKPQPLTKLLTVKKSVTLFPSLLARSESSEGPFLLSMIGRKTVKKMHQEVNWVQGDPAEVVMVVSNPLPTELKVEKMAISLVGASVITYPSNISLPPKCESQEFVLLCIPQEAGTLSMAGYTATILGLSNRSSATNSDCTIKVIPSLPQLRVRVFPQDDSTGTGGSKRNSTSSIGSATKRRSITNLDNFELLDGEMYQCTIQFQSIGDVPIECVKMTLLEQNVEYCRFSWKEEEFDSLFPLSEKNKGYHFPVKVTTSFPNYLRVGSCKVLYHRSRINSLFSPAHKTNQAPAATDKAKTLAIVSRERPVSSSSSSGGGGGGGGTGSERSSNTSSLLSSPIRLMRRDGSLRRSSGSKKDNGKSELLESLDLQQRGSPGGPSSLIPSSPAKRGGGGVIKEQLLGLKDWNEREITNQLHKKLDSSHRRSPSLILRNKKMAAQKTTTTTGDNSLVDSLNLETKNMPPQAPSSSDKDHTSIVRDHARVSPSPQSLSTSNERPRHSGDQWSVRSDTNSDIIDFDGLASDRTSIKSDPGIDILPLPFGGGGSLISNTSKGSGAMTLSPASSSSFKLSTLMKKRPVVGQASLPFVTVPSKVAQPVKGPSLPLISRPTKAEKLRPRPGKKLVKTVFLMQYTGGEGAKEGYYREVSLELSCVVKPTLIFDEFVITSIKGYPDLFNFGMVMENVSPYALDVTINIKQDNLSQNEYTYTLDADRNDTIVLPMRRFALPEKDNSIKEANVIKHYCEHLVSLLEIKWSSRGNIGKKGGLSLNGLQLPQSVLSIIRPLPILFDIRTEASVFSPGVPITVAIKVTNHTSGVLPASLITLSPFFLNPKGQKVECTKKKHYLLHSQSLSQWIPQLDQDGSYLFSFFLIFLYSNEYLIDIVHHIIEQPTEGKDTTTDNVNGAVTKEGSSNANARTTADTDNKTLEDSSPRPMTGDNSGKQQQGQQQTMIVLSSVVPVMNYNNDATTTNSSGGGALGDGGIQCAPQGNKHELRNTNRTKEFIDISRAYIGPQLTIRIE